MSEERYREPSTSTQWWSNRAGVHNRRWILNNFQRFLLKLQFVKVSILYWLVTLLWREVSTWDSPGCKLLEYQISSWTSFELVLRRGTSSRSTELSNLNVPKLNCGDFISDRDAYVDSKTVHAFTLQSQMELSVPEIARKRRWIRKLRWLIYLWY